ncbi:MAG: hypothetical protein VR73_09220 [Gammaproteobacteria bacterium BRH_c0]|nr:MAG: hypothetical protein VR73_09220 [Gammaproteobacteria bacterium BRH_c0]
MRILAILILIAFAQTSLATTWIKQSISEYFNDADIVARIYVKKGDLIEVKYKGEKIGCAQNVEAEVLESFKGPSKEVKFYITGMILNQAEEYLVFLKKHSSQELAPIASTNSIAYSEEEILRNACSKYLKGYKANWLSVSSFVTRWSDEKDHYERWVTPAYNIEIPEEADITFQSVQLHGLKIDGEVVSKDYWGVDDKVAMPDIFWMYDGAYEWESYKKYMTSEVMEIRNPPNGSSR